MIASSSAPPATLVLTNGPLFRHIMSFIDGVRGSIVSQVTSFQRLHPWSATGALPLAAIQRGDLETLRALYKLSTTKKFQQRPELSLSGSACCAIQFGQLEILQYLANKELLLETLSTTRTVGSSLLGWTIRYSEELQTDCKLAIVHWVDANFPRSTLQDVDAQDLSHASVLMLSFLKDQQLATRGLQDPRLVDLMATMGKIDTLMFLLGGGATCSTDAVDGAATNGHLEIVQYLHSNRTEGCTVAAIDGAARNGHLTVVKFLHRQRTEGCTVAAMDNAATNGHLAVVKFLHVNRTEGCTTAAMDGAAAGGFLEVVKFLQEYRREGCTTKAMDGAARNGHLKVMKFLHEYCTEGCTTDAMDGAALVGRLEVIKFLHENRNEGCTTRAVDGAAWRGHFEVVNFLITHRDEGCTYKAMDTACQNGYLEIVRFLHTQGSVTCTTAAMDSAASGGYLEIVQFLQENRVEGCTKDAMTNAALNGHADVVLYLGEHRHEGPHEYTLERVAAQGNADCVEALIRCTIRGCLFEARDAALQAGHPQLAILLSAWMNPEVASCSQYYHQLCSPRWCQRSPQRTIMEAATSKTFNMSSSTIQKRSDWWSLFRWL